MALALTTLLTFPRLATGITSYEYPFLPPVRMEGKNNLKKKKEREKCIELGGLYFLDDLLALKKHLTLFGVLLY